MITCPYERNDYVAQSDANIKIGALKALSRSKFDKWCEKLRADVAYAWDELGIPFSGGKSADRIVSDLKRVAIFDTNKVVQMDELDGQMNCLVNRPIGGSCVQFFPTLLKTRDISNGSMDGQSIYRYFADPEYEQEFKDTLWRMVRNDPFALFKDDDKRIMDASSIFRVCFPMRPATNFPPVIAKYLYLRFTEGLDEQERYIVYDPCAGWGGRLLGALACCNERPIHYVGTDPNTDHWMPELEITKYEYLAGYFNGNVRGQYQTTYEIFSSVSEEIHKNKCFQKYKGQFDFVFTSPPYFAAEGYSQDETQAFKKFPTYEEWRDGFLKGTLSTCVEYLKESRYLCWNIADIRFASTVLSLQNDTIGILKSLGMEYHGFLKLILVTSPGGNRANENDVPTTINFCKLNGRIRKYEPILIFKKSGNMKQGHTPIMEELLR